MTRPLTRAGGVFAAFHEQLMAPAIDYAAFDRSRYPAERLQWAARVWQNRVETEFRSIQIMNRFFTEVVGSGDPIDVYAGALDLVEDEIKHTALCAGVVEALGGRPHYPAQLELRDPERFVAAPMPERALSTAISMVAINETLSVGYVEDLAARCTDPVIGEVLRQTVGDEEQHQEFGWSYVEQALGRFDRSTLGDWRHLVKLTLEPHFADADPILDRLTGDARDLASWPEQQLADLGLFSDERQALVFERTYRDVLAPRLRRLELVR